VDLRCFRPDLLSRGLGEEGAVMTGTLNDVTRRKNKPDPTPEELAAVELVRQAREQGLSLTGPDGLLKQFVDTPTSIRRSPPPSRATSIPAAKSVEMPRLAARRFPVPAGRIAIAASVPTNAPSADMAVPSPPQTNTTVAPASMAVRV
jgi:hypothetical protein